MNSAIVRTIYAKEMLDTLRDRRTVIAMVVVPILLYPALFLVAIQVALFQQEKVSTTTSRIAVAGEDVASVVEWIGAIEKVEIIDTEDPVAGLAKGDLDAVVRVEGSLDETLAREQSVPIRVEYDLTESASRKAADRVAEGLREKSEELVKERVARRALPEGFARPLEVETENVAPPAKTAGSIIGLILPLLMVLMLGVGAFYPAIDITAGEKERGTFETLLSTPTTKLEMVAGKFLAVFSLSMATGLLNLASMGLTLSFQLSMLLGEVTGEEWGAAAIRLPFESLPIIILAMIPLSFFISAVMMTAALFTRSFKEAQNLMTPIFLAIILPAAVGSVPEIELSKATQFIPIANATLLFRELMVGPVGADMIFAVLLSSSVYALLALVIAARLFQSEEVILAEDRGVPLTFNRAYFERRSEPTPGLALGLFGLVLLLIFYAGTYAQAKDPLPGLVFTQYALILAPVLAVLWFTRVRLKTALNLSMPNTTALAGTLALTAAWSILIMQIAFWNNNALPLPEEMTEVFNELFSVGDTGWGVVILLFAVALSPALCEEALFRGAMVSGLRQRLPQWGTILTVGLAFGVFHLSIYRFGPTAASGIVLTYLAVRSGSILPSVLCHFFFNGLAVLIQTNRAPAFILNWLESEAVDTKGVPLPALLGALALAGAGVYLIERSALKSRRRESI